MEQEATKTCSKCGEIKPLDRFLKSSKTGRLLLQCKDCDNKRSREYYQRRMASDPEGMREKFRRNHKRQALRGYKRPPRKNSHNHDWRTVRKFKQYNITHEEYIAILERQQGVCAICGKPETVKHQNGEIRALAIDHDHVTGKVRGLLCFRCNTNLETWEKHTSAFQAYLARAAKY